MLGLEVYIVLSFFSRKKGIDSSLDSDLFPPSVPTFKRKYASGKPVSKHEKITKKNSNQSLFFLKV